MVEWIWLLDQAGHQDTNLIIKLMESARSHGYIEELGCLANSFDLRTGDYSQNCRLWPQTEHIRACLVLARRTSDDHWLDEAASLLHQLHNNYFEGIVSGGYHDEITVSGQVLSDRSPASLIYHHVTLADELLKI